MAGFELNVAPCPLFCVNSIYWGPRSVSLNQTITNAKQSIPTDTPEPCWGSDFDHLISIGPFKPSAKKVVPNKAVKSGEKPKKNTVDKLFMFTLSGAENETGVVPLMLTLATKAVPKCGLVHLYLIECISHALDLVFR